MGEAEVSQNARCFRNTSIVTWYFIMTLQDINAKHDKLKKIDGRRFFKKSAYKIFGSVTHKYKFNPCLAIDTLSKFEKEHSTILPHDYKSFITKIGNGGSGPAYGLFPLSKWSYELDIRDQAFLSTTFPHRDKWNMNQNFDTNNENYTETEEFQKWEEEYYASKHVTGSIRICHYGCAIYYLLVVMGSESGNIWIDDRVSDNGIYPAKSDLNGGRLTFIKWHDEWLTESLRQIP